MRVIYCKHLIKSKPCRESALIVAFIQPVERRGRTRLSTFTSSWSHKYIYPNSRDLFHNLCAPSQPAILPNPLSQFINLRISLSSNSTTTCTCLLLSPPYIHKTNPDRPNQALKCFKAPDYLIHLLSPSTAPAPPALHHTLYSLCNFICEGRQYTACAQNQRIFRSKFHPSGRTMNSLCWSILHFPIEIFSPLWVKGSKACQEWTDRYDLMQSFAITASSHCILQHTSIFPKSLTQPQPPRLNSNYS